MSEQLYVVEAYKDGVMIQRSDPHPKSVCTNLSMEYVLDHETDELCFVPVKARSVDEYYQTGEDKLPPALSGRGEVVR